MTKLATDHVARVATKERPEKVKNDIAPHVEASFRRCLTIKTLLNPHHASNFLSIYATQRFTRNGRGYDQYGLVEQILGTLNHVIITGTGGSGKSMFMRYLWLSAFERGDGRIPLFVDLKNINALSKPHFETYLLHTLTQGRSSITAKEFRRRLESGSFFLILDGFDEVSHDVKDVVQASIMATAEHYPRLKIVLSSRPDDRFASWPSFDVVKVSPMQKGDVIELIDKAEFDHATKSRFVKKVKEDPFYSRYESFLSNPLLASMMLVTFSRNNDVPNRTHLFYEEAFNALYQRHDSHKPGTYKREFKSGCPEDHFKRVFSYFCLISYYKEKTEFDAPRRSPFSRMPSA